MDEQQSREGSATDYVVALTTLGTEDDAVVLARALLERRLVACVNVVTSVKSLYRWKGAIEEEREVLLLMKTRGGLFSRLEAAVSELHPYDVPELLRVPVDGGAAPYLRWIDECLAGE